MKGGSGWTVTRTRGLALDILRGSLAGTRQAPHTLRSPEPLRGGPTGQGSEAQEHPQGAPAPAAAARTLRTPAFHDLLQFHLQGLDGTRWVITGRTLDPVNGEFPTGRGGDVVVLEEDDAVGVFYDGAGARQARASRGGGNVLDGRETAIMPGRPS